MGNFARIFAIREKYGGLECDHIAANGSFDAATTTTTNIVDASTTTTSTTIAANGVGDCLKTAGNDYSDYIFDKYSASHFPQSTFP